MNNLVKRSLSGLVFLAIMIFCIWYNALTFWILSCVIAVLGMLEVYRMFLPNRNIWQTTLSIIAGVCLIKPNILYYLSNDIFYISNLAEAISQCMPILLMMAVFIIELYKKSEKPIINLSIYLFAVLYVALPFALMNSMTNSFVHDISKLFILLFFILVWANDVGAYCVGSTLGKKIKAKLFPRISPNKSWAGFFGGLLVTIIVAIFVSFEGNDDEESSSIIRRILIAIIISVFCTFGDLFESMLKRSAGVKDSGNIIPGHGGILDRFDAVLFAFPAVYILFQIIGFI